MDISDIQFLFEYNYWANKLILSKAAELTAGQLSQLAGFSWGSLHGTLAHTLDSEYVWRNICQYQRVVEKRLDETTFPTLDSLSTFWQVEENEMRAYLYTLRDRDMATIVRYEIPEGVRERVLWHCLVHVVNHGMQHRSECAVMLTNFGHSPGDLDMTRFLNLRAGIE